MSELALTLRQPAQVGDKARSDFVLGTHHYLPGTVVRGAFAAAWIAAHGVPSHDAPGRQEFLRLFEGEVRFGPLFGPAQVLPLSVVGHKYNAPAECQDAEYDRALQDDVPDHCPDCRTKLEHPKGLRGGPIGESRRTSVAIATSGVARRGLIVTRDTLNPGQSFRGNLVASDPTLLDILARLGRVRVGGRRTTHGSAEVSIADGAPPPTAQRRDDGLLVVRLRSPGIFVDECGRPSCDPTAAELADVLGVPAQVMRRWTRWDTTGGWHLASGLPKPAELAVAPGSTYLIETTGAVTDEALDVLGRRGLGLRRHEGFGDLAPPPVLKPGRRAREQEQQRQRRLLDDARPLRGLEVTQPAMWEPLPHALGAHAAGDQSATGFLRTKVQELDSLNPHAARALTSFLGLAPDDAAYVAGELSKP